MAADQPWRQEPDERVEAVLAVLRQRAAQRRREGKSVPAPLREAISDFGRALNRHRAPGQRSRREPR